MTRRLPDTLPVLGRRAARDPALRRGQRELTEPVDLCDGRGELKPGAVGWSRRPLVRANLSGHPLRKKRWNFWNWIDPDFVLSVTLADVDYASLCAWFFIDLQTGESVQGSSVGLPGRFELPEHVERSVTFHSGRVEYENRVEHGGHRVHLRAPTREGREITAVFAVRTPPGQESLNVVVPWTRRRFQLNSKHNTLPCEGSVTVGGRRWNLAPERCHAVQDWGRGVWPYRSFWNWGVGTGVQDGRRIGVNVGARWTTGTGANENGVLLDGRLHKLHEELDWSYDPADPMKPWCIRSRDGESVDLVLHPRVPHRSRLWLGLLATGGVCCFGRWTGRVRAGDETLEIRDLPGWAEEFAHRW